MKERPILFSGAMIRAILADQKTQTRRAVKPVKHPDLGNLYDPGALVSEPQHVIDRACPYGQPGERLWVRETHSLLEFSISGRAAPVWYWADGNKIPEGDYTRPRPSIHMPRWASRILLEIVSVRVERLQDISEADAEAEGCERLDSDRDERDWKICPQCGGTRLHSAMGGGGGVIFDCDCRECDTYVKRYRHLWDGINGEGSWAANPWVWVVEFKRVEGQPL